MDDAVVQWQRKIIIDNVASVRAIVPFIFVDLRIRVVFFLHEKYVSAARHESICSVCRVGVRCRDVLCPISLLFMGGIS